jgi:hypothetical protein
MPTLDLQSVLIWTVTPVLQLVCVYLLYRRNLLQQFKFLASFLVFLTLKAGILFLCYRYSSANSWTYYASYWVGTAMADMFKIAVLYEIFCAAFKPFAGLQDLAKVVFKWAAASILVIGLLVFVSNPAAQQNVNFYWLFLGINSFERIVRVMECALLIFLFMGSQHMGVSKKNRVFGFALGFGIDAFFQLLVFSALATSHISKMHTLAEFLPVVYFSSVLIWLGYLLQPERAREPLHIPVTSPLLRWNEVALALGHSGGKVAVNGDAEPFMPSVERMVEQVMQKEMIIDRRQPRVV